jgi:hypothetical protein
MNPIEWTRMGGAIKTNVHLGGQIFIYLFIFFWL